MTTVGLPDTMFEFDLSQSLPAYKHFLQQPFAVLYRSLPLLQIMQLAE